MTAFTTRPEIAGSFGVVILDPLDRLAWSVGRTTSGIRAARSPHAAAATGVARSYRRTASLRSRGGEAPTTPGKAGAAQNMCATAGQGWCSGWRRLSLRPMRNAGPRLVLVEGTSVGGLVPFIFYAGR